LPGRRPRRRPWRRPRRSKCLVRGQRFSNGMSERAGADGERHEIRVPRSTLPRFHAWRTGRGDGEPQKPGPGSAAPSGRCHSCSHSDRLRQQIGRSPNALGHRNAHHAGDNCHHSRQRDRTLRHPPKAAARREDHGRGT
jgi:hypothetical protein